MSPCSPAPALPLVGASGAVSGILGAYVVLFPKARVWILLFLRIPIRIGALWVLGGWFGLQLFSYWMDYGKPDANIAWGAHIGGFLGGHGHHLCHPPPPLDAACSLSETSHSAIKRRCWN